MFYIIFIKALVAFAQIARQRFAIPTASVGNMTLPGFPPSFSPITKTQFNKDVCLFTWPIQRLNLFPTTTLNDVAATLMIFLEPAPVKPVPQDTCPPFLPIQRINLAPVTNINDIASIAAVHYAMLEQSIIDDPGQLIINPTFDTGNDTSSKTFYFIPVAAVYIVALVPNLLVMAATISLVLRHKRIGSLTSLEQHFELLGRQQRERSREAQLEKVHARLAGQEELIQFLQAQLQLTRSKEKTATLKSKRLETINSSQHTEIDRLRAQRNNVAVQPTFIPNLSRTIHSSNYPTSSVTGTPCPSPSSTSVSNPNESTITGTNDTANSDDFPTVTDITIDQTTVTLTSTPITPTLPTVNIDQSVGEEDQVPSLVDEDSSWTVVRRRKKRQDRAKCSDAQVQ